MSRPKGSKNRLNNDGTVIESPVSKDVLPIEGLVVNEEWVLKSDDLNIILLRKRGKEHHLSKQDSPDSYEYFYYATIAGALTALLEKEVKSTNLSSIQAINDRIGKIEQDIKNTLETLTMNSTR